MDIRRVIAKFGLLVAALAVSAQYSGVLVALGPSCN